MENLSRRAFGGLIVAGAAAAASPAWAIAPPGWEIGFQTAPSELDSELTVLSGRIPSDLQGALYRNGPAQFERGGERLGHWFDGDGMIQRFAIGGGRVRHRGRFVLTDKRKAEEAAERFLYFGYGFTPKNSAIVRQLDDLNSANTSVLAFGDEVWALWEGGSPWRVNGETLATIGRKAFPSEYDGLPFSAHPKRGPDGDIWNFGAIGNRCVIWRLNADGSIKTAAVIELPVPSLMHDFAVTRTKVILVLPPLLASGSVGPALVDRYAWNGSEPMRVVVMDKDDLSKRRVHELPARFLFHIGNAWEDNAGVLRFDACLLEDASFASQGTRDLSLGRYVEHLKARPTLVTIRPSGPNELAPLDIGGEFPRTDPRRVGERHDITYGIVEFGIGKWNWKTGERTSHVFSPYHWSEEPVFVPRPNKTEEDDGWLITTTLNTKTRKTELAIFDARHVDDGPLAHMACPYVLPLGFHGTFAET